MGKSNHNFKIDKILDAALQERNLSRSDILCLLNAEKPDETRKIFDAARKLRQKYFGNKIFLYGFLYISTYCRNNCSFCYYRVSNRKCSRYRKTEEEIIKAAVDIAGSGVHLLDLTMGEDPLYFEKDGSFEPVLNMARQVKKSTGLPIMISFGCLPDRILKNLIYAGADWFACYQETHNKELFSQLRQNQSFDERLQKKYKAAEMGFLIEEGILGGAGESPDDVADSFEEMKRMGAHQLRIMNFIPQDGTPMQKNIPPPVQYELAIIAVLRLLFPDRLIPASLDVYGIDGLKSMLNAGANVITSLILPQSKMAGVARSHDIDDGCRTVKGVIPILDSLGLTKAETDDYISWMEREKALL